MLQLCADCQRHHRKGSACPHCGGGALAFAAEASPIGPVARAVKKLKVGGLMAFTAATTSACYGTPAVVGLPETPPTGLTVPLDAMPVGANRANVYLLDAASMAASPSPQGAKEGQNGLASARPSPVASSPEPVAFADAASSLAQPVASPTPGASPRPAYSVGMEVRQLRMEDGRLRMSLWGPFDNLNVLLELPENQDPFALKEARHFALAEVAGGSVEGRLNQERVLFVLPGAQPEGGQISFTPQADGLLEMRLKVSQRGRRLQIHAVLRLKPEGR